MIVFCAKCKAQSSGNFLPEDEVSLYISRHNYEATRLYRIPTKKRELGLFFFDSEILTQSRKVWWGETCGVLLGCYFKKLLRKRFILEKFTAKGLSAKTITAFNFEQITVNAQCYSAKAESLVSRNCVLRPRKSLHLWKESPSIFRRLSTRVFISLPLRWKNDIRMLESIPSKYEDGEEKVWRVWEMATTLNKISFRKIAG